MFTLRYGLQRDLEKNLRMSLLKYVTDMRSAEVMWAWMTEMERRESLVDLWCCNIICMKHYQNYIAIQSAYNLKS